MRCVGLISNVFNHWTCFFFSRFFFYFRFRIDAVYEQQTNWDLTRIDTRPLLMKWTRHSQNWPDIKRSYTISTTITTHTDTRIRMHATIILFLYSFFIAINQQQQKYNEIYLLLQSKHRSNQIEYL